MLAAEIGVGEATDRHRWQELPHRKASIRHRGT
jgi:hypothetical protein